MCMKNGNGYEAIETADITKTLPITHAHTSQGVTLRERLSSELQWL